MVKQRMLKAKKDSSGSSDEEESNLNKKKEIAVPSFSQSEIKTNSPEKTVQKPPVTDTIENNNSFFKKEIKR